MIKAAIECVVSVVHEYRDKYTDIPGLVAHELEVKFGFIEGQDFTRADINKEMSKYRW